jgi:hypothetical protein
MVVIPSFAVHDLQMERRCHLQGHASSKISKISKTEVANFSSFRLKASLIIPLACSRHRYTSSFFGEPRIGKTARTRFSFLQNPAENHFHARILENTIDDFLILNVARPGLAY